MSDWFPAPPDVPAEQRASGDSALRYEDVAQDGRVMLLGLPHVIGDVLWRRLLVHHPINRAQHAGVISVLTRFVLEGHGGPLSVRWPLAGDARFQLAHTVGSDGAVNRLLVNMWADLTGVVGRTNGPPPPNAGEKVPVGRVFAEHVLTRLFAAPADRKVVRLAVAGLPEVPPDRWQWRHPGLVLAPPPGATLLDPEPRADDGDVVFGLNHTDSNQHVNSLVYPRLFTDAALRRLAAHGRDTRVLATRLEIAYRKPCFAGQRARIVLSAFADGDRLGATGAFVSDAAPWERPHCTLQISFT